MPGMARLAQVAELPIGNGVREKINGSTGPVAESIIAPVTPNRSCGRDNVRARVKIGRAPHEVQGRSNAASLAACYSRTDAGCQPPGCFRSPAPFSPEPMRMIRPRGSSGGSLGPWAGGDFYLPRSAMRLLPSRPVTINPCRGPSSLRVAHMDGGGFPA